MTGPHYVEENIARLLKALDDEPVHVSPAFRGQLQACLRAEAQRLARPWWKRFLPGAMHAPRRWGFATALAAAAVVVAIGVLIGVLFVPLPDSPTQLTVHSGSVVVRQTRSSLLGMTREATHTVEIGESLELAAGDRVTAGPDAWAILTFPDDSWSELKDGADVTLAVVQPATKAMPFYVLLQVWAGPTHHHVERSLGADERFEVETATSVASARSGEFYVTVVSAGHTFLATDEGVVNVVSANGQKADVLPGYQANVLADQSLKVCPQPPVWSEVAAGQDAELRLTGHTVKDAELWLIVQEKKFAHFTADSKGQFEHVFTAPAQGVYSLQLKAIGAGGQMSDASDPRVWLYDPALSLWLWLDEPSLEKEDGSAARAHLAGQAHAGATVALNKRLAHTTAGGRFKTEVELKEGRNVLALLVTDSAGDHSALELEVAFVRDGDSGELYAKLIPQHVDSPPPPRDAPGLSIAMFAPTLVEPGQVFTYTLVAQNHTGITPATTIITSSVPNGADLVAGTLSHGGVASDRVVTWAISGLAHGATVTRTFRVTATTSGLTIVNDAYGVNGGSDWVTTTSGQAVTVCVPQLLIAKSGPASVSLGEVFSYTLAITNHTSGALNHLLVSDTLPAGVGYKSSHPPGVWLSASHTLVWNVVSLPCSGELPVGRRCQGTSNASLAFTVVVTAPDVVTIVANSDYSARAANWTMPSRGAPVFSTVGDHTPIYAIQGRAFRSPMASATIETVGVVVGFFQGDYRNGFYIQAPSGDGDEATSDGVFVRHPASLNPGLSVGDLVTVTGTVGEFSERDGLSCNDDACETQIVIGKASAVEVGAASVMPTATELNPPGAPQQAAIYWESREGMLATLPNTATVVGFSVHGDIVVVRGDLGIERVMRTGPYTGMPVGVRAYRESGLAANLSVGSVVENADGPLAFVHGDYALITQPDDAWKAIFSKPVPAQAPSWPEATANKFSAATFNALDFDIASGNKVVATIAQLGCPTFLALEEIDVERALSDLLSSLEARGCSYSHACSPADADGHGVALLWRTDRVSAVTWTTRYQACSTAGSSSASYDPLWDDCQGLARDVYPLFARRPVVLSATVSLGGGDLPLVVIANHFMSGAASAERARLEQGQFVAGLVDDANSPHVIVLGDLNDVENSPPLEALYANGRLINTWYTLPEDMRYSYIYQGVSQARDHILVSPAMMAMLQDVGPLHYNADHAYGYGGDGSVWHTSTHDPVAATFAQNLLNITKTVETAHTPVRLGDLVTYTIVVANEEDKDATGVIISDVLPLGLIGPGLDWVGTISANEQVEFHLQAFVVVDPAFYGQTIQNTAAYSYTDVHGSDSASFSVESAPAPSLSITKTVETLRTPVQQGDLVTYTMLVGNSGNQVASGVFLTDVLPSEVDFSAWIKSPPLDTAVARDVIAWRGSVDVDEVITWTFTANVTGAYSAIVVNSASIVHDGAQDIDSAAFAVEPEPATVILINEIMQNPAVVSDWNGEWIELYNADSKSVDVNGCTLKANADSHVIDHDGPLVVMPGAYLVLGNNGDPSANGGVAVTYVYTGFSLANDADQVVLECDGSEVDRVDYDGGAGFPEPEGASMQLADPARDNNVGANWCEAITAWPDSAGDGGTPGAANNCPVADLSVTKTIMTAQGQRATVRPGVALIYSIVVANNGNADAIGIHVLDTLPPGISGTDLDQIVDIAAGERKTFVIPTTVTTDTGYYGQTIVNVAYFDHASGSGWSSASFDVKPAQGEPKLTVTKTVETLHSPVRLGDPVAYTIVVANNGDSAATGVVVTDELPLGLKLGGCMGDECTARLPPSDHTLLWEWDVVPAGASHTIRFISTMTSSVAFFGQVITNTVAYTSANASSGAYDATFVVEAAPTLLPITLTVESARIPVQLGDLVTYTVVVANRGDEDAANMVITDHLPLGMIGSDLLWTGTVTAHSQVRFILPAVLTTDTAYYGRTIVNTAHYSHTSDRGSDDARLIVWAPYRIFLPIIIPAMPHR